MFDTKNIISAVLSGDEPEVKLLVLEAISAGEKAGADRFQYKQFNLRLIAA